MDIKTLESFSLGDAIFFHDDLNKNLWDMNNELRPEVKKQLIIIAKDFIEELGIKDLDVKDITVSGSNAAYTYTKHSDLDLHILVDMDKLPENEVYRELFTAKKNLYNDSHDIKVHGVPVELYVQDSNEPVVSLGEYSILKDKWLRIPTKRRANFDQTITKQKYKKLLDIIEKALKTKDLEKVNNIITTIKRYRKAGLDRGGEFGPENLAYKALRTQGYIDKLYNLRDKLHSIDLSIEEQYKVNPIVPTVPIQKTITYPKQDVYIGGAKKLVPKPDVTFDIGNNKDTNNLVYTLPNQSEIEENIYFNNPKQLIDLYLRKVDSKNLGSITLTKILQGLPYGNLDTTLDFIFKKYNIKPTDIVWQPSDKTNEDYDPNGPPPGPEFKPTMPKGTVRVDVSDVYDWYKLGQHISNMQGLGKHDFGKGPPSTIMAFGDEDLEHQYIQALKKTGLSTTDIDPASHKKIKGQKVDPTYNVNEVFNTKPGKKNNAYWEHEGEDGSTLHFDTSNGIEYRLDIIPMWMGADEAKPWEFADTTDEQEELGRYVEFSQNDPDNWMGGKKDVTGTGSSAEIFGIVVNGILQYVKKFKPPFLMMQAAEMNRRRLYNAMLTRLLPLMPGYKSIGPKADGMYFIYDSRVIKPKVSEEEKPKQASKSAIYSTDVYGMTAYHSKCLEPGCDWESKRYDSIKLAQNAAQKHAQKHFKQGVAEAAGSLTFAGKDPMSFKSPKGGTPTMVVVTAQGSRYLITSDGMVLRNKSFHANTGGEDQGLKSWSDVIEFYDPAELPGGVTFPLSVSKAVEKRLPVALSKTPDGKRALMIYDGSKWKVAKISDVYKHVATTDDPIIGTYSTTPKLNWNVLDYTIGPNKTLKSVHPGSPVTHGIRLGKQGVAEGKVINTYLWHGSRQKIPMLEPRQSVDTGGAAGSNQNAIYATSDPKVAIAMGLTTPGSDTGMFPNDPQMVLFSGKIRKGEYVYLHKLPFNGPDGKPQFVQGGNSREYHTIPSVRGIKPIEIKEIPVNRYLNLIRKATPADLKLRKKYMKKAVKEVVNPDILDKKISKEPTPYVPMGDFEFKARIFRGRILGHGNPNDEGLHITAYDPKQPGRNVIGHVQFVVKSDEKGNQWLESAWTEVDEDYDGRGVAAMMYAFAKSLGNDIKPSPDQSTFGKEMWRKWGKDAKHLVGEQGVAEGLDNIPAILYHATYRPLLKSIKKYGLGGDRAQAKWEDSRPGVVYSALDKDVAESYAESSDVVPEEWLDEIVILKISTNGLDKNKFHLDKNVLDNQGDTVEYHGVIPVTNISLIKQGVTEAFDQPYPITWEHDDYGNIDALATLDDGTYLSINFNTDNVLNNWTVEFHRNNSTLITGEGDSQRVFATVMTAIKQFINEYNPNMIYFSAVKSDDPKGSRTSLYDKLVQRFAASLGYTVKKLSKSDETGYNLSRIEKVKEGASGYIPSNSEKDDPRFKTALTVDIKPDTMKKDAKKFGNKISRAGIPPTLNPSGKF